MLAKKNRLTKNKDFDNVFNNGQSSYDKLSGIKIISNNLAYNRFGVLVGSKISQKAVERNKIKRQIREIISLNLDKLKQGYDCVIVISRLILGKKYLDLEKSLIGNFKKLKLFK